MVAATLAAGGSRAEAGFVIAGASSGVAISANLTIAGALPITLSVNALSGTAPGAYNKDSTQASANLGALGVIAGSTGALDSKAFSDINGPSASGSATSATTINNLDFKLGAAVVSTALEIKATTMTTTSSASGSYGSLATLGSPVIENLATTGLAITVFGVDITALVRNSAGSVVNIGQLAGLSIGIDVVQQGGDGITTADVRTDNIIINLNAVNLGVAGVGLVSGTIVIGESTASISATVPEPASASMVGVGVVLAGFVGARRARSRRPIATA